MIPPSLLVSNPLTWSNSLIQMTVAIREDEEEAIQLQQQAEELRLKKLARKKKSPTFTSMLTENELQIHQTTNSDSRSSTPGTDLLFPHLHGKISKDNKGDDTQQISSRKLKKLMKVYPSSFPLFPPSVSSFSSRKVNLFPLTGRSLLQSYPRDPFPS